MPTLSRAFFARVGAPFFTRVGAPFLARIRALFSCARTRGRAAIGIVVALLALAPPLASPARSGAATRPVSSAPVSSVAAQTPSQTGESLESAASKASSLGRKVAMSLIGLGFAVASIVLVFRRDFKEAAGVFTVGLLAILLATPAGVNVLHATVNTLFGAS